MAVLGWVCTSMSMIGGLTDVGFSSDSRLLLVVGHQGRGVFDCQTGQRLARERADDWSYFDDNSATVEGVGPLEGQSVAVAGLMSSKRLPTESDGWSVSATGAGVLLRSPTGENQAIEETEDVRVFGFAPDGATLVVGTPSAVSIYRRVG